MGQRLPVPQPAAVGDGFDKIAPHGVDGLPGDMRVSTTLSRPSSGYVRRHRFGVEDIQAGGGHPAAAERLDQQRPSRRRCPPRVWRRCHSRPIRLCRRRCRGRSRRAAGRTASRGLRGWRGPASAAGAARPASAAPFLRPPTARWRRACWRRRSAPGGRVDVDGVDPGAEFVDQPQSGRTPRSAAESGRSTCHMTSASDSSRSNAACDSAESSSAHHRISSQSASGRKETQHFRTGNKVGEDP